MPLVPGTRIGSYEVLALIGVGGMGEVYRARDTRLNRDVALKVLPAAVSTEHDRRTRFEREAQLLAALNHSNIASIYGIDDSQERLTLVMELVEGETIADRIARGRFPQKEAVAIAIQICLGLEYAHEHGIVHRDLKPANIKVTPDGGVKILDFGLAKALDDAPVAAHVSQSPTLTIAATRAGVVLGTVSYMSPEQARGQNLDRRTDIWSFGCVLFEMLTGHQAFAGETISDVLASVLRVEPQWAQLPAETSVSVALLIRRCLQKDPKRRFQHIGDARLDLEASSDQTEVVPATGSRRSGRESIVRILGAAVGVGVVSLVAALAFWPTPQSRDVARFSIELPIDLPFRTAPTTSGVVLTPDGTSIVYTSGGQGALVRRRIDRSNLETLRVTGTSPFFSPDGKWIAFFEDGKLKKALLEGGLATTVVDNLPAGRGAWGDDGQIVVCSLDGRILQVSSDGGVPEVLGGEAPTSCSQPAFVPGSRTVLFQVGPFGDSKIQALLSDGSRRDIVDGSSPQMTADGYLVFERSGGLWAAKLDTKTLRLDGNPIPMLDSLRVQGGVALYGISRTGTLAYIRAGAVRTAELVWLDRQGRATPALETRAAFLEPRLSPQGRLVAVAVRSGNGTSIWVYELDRGVGRRLTTGDTEARPVWTPDGSQIAFQVQGAQFGGDIYMRNVDGTGDTDPLIVEPSSQFPDAWSPDGKFLIYNQGTAVRDLWLFARGSKPAPLVVTRFNERSASLSPDGRWLTFVSDESGRDEVFIQQFPGPGPKITISTRGGKQPRWSRDGREVFYRDEDALMSVPVGRDPLHPGPPVRLFDLARAVYGDDPNRVEYDVAADGRFLAVRAEGPGSQEAIDVVLHWTDELKRQSGR